MKRGNMKKAKISDSEIKLLLLLLALILLAAAYYFGYNRNIAAAQKLETQNVTDQQTVDRLEGMVRKRPIVEKQIETLNKTVDDIIARYPSLVTTEKAISIVQDLEYYSGVTVTSIGFLMDNQVMAFTQTVEGQNTPPTGYYAQLSMNYVSSYEGYKSMLLYVESLTKDRTTIPTVSASYDPVTDMLQGTVTLNMFYLTNTGREYEPPRFDGILKGKDSIFGAGEGIAAGPGEGLGWPAEGDTAAGTL